jgi:NADH-quinone oxidoreductase subunit L
MYQAIVFLPLLGFLLAGAATILAHKLGRDVVAFGDADHSVHATHSHAAHASDHNDDTHDDHHHSEPSPQSPNIIRFAEFATTGLLFISAFLSWIAFSKIALGQGETVRVTVANWISVGNLQVNWALLIDPLTAVMLVVVTSVSSLVHLYSIDYMAEDPHRPRFFAYLSLFTFAMLMLVTSDNLVQMFFGWEGVGLASYLLIGFWYYKKTACDAAMKAFIVNRVGDFGFALGIFLVFVLFQTVSLDQIFAAAPSQAKTNFTFMGITANAMTITCLLLFMGAMGKSAQFMLHTWLPDAMEGPTPVSALIHAATMVTAGVFMVARLSPLFELSPDALSVVLVIGAITAFFAATIGLVQNDIKRVIAYSTCSQLGYMFVALGAGAYSAGVFHLFTHAFFKALLFLGAGSVIHAMHHEQDIRKMGGLAKYIPFTTAMMAIGTLALTGFPFLAGYFSKDAIIEAAYASNRPGHIFAFICVLSAALMTSFYSWRLFFMTFMGKSRASQETLSHVHESPLSMTLPLAFLAFGAMFAGYPFAEYFIGNGFDGFWKTSLFISSDNHILHDMHSVPKWVHFAPFIAMIVGFALAYYYYIAKPERPAQIAAAHPSLYQFLLNKWYFDELYDLIFVNPAKKLGSFFWKTGDGKVIDGFGPDGIAAGVLLVTGRVTKLQSGLIYHYAFTMLIGVAALISWYMFGGAH